MTATLTDADISTILYIDKNRILLLGDTSSEGDLQIDEKNEGISAK